MIKVVCFGGGNAIPKLILPELKSRGFEVTSVTSMVDSGGSTGQLRNDFGILPPGDIRRHLIALSDAPKWKKDLFAFRFGQEIFDGGHKGHSFGNIFIGGLEHTLKDYRQVLEIVHEFLEVKGKCLPATIENTHVVAKLETGELVEGEDEIDVPKKHNPVHKIEEAYLQPKVKAYPETINAIIQADLITFGPGDMYSSLIPCFLPLGIKEALRKTSAKKVLICPAMSKLGETHWFTVRTLSEEIEKYIGCKLDKIIFNVGKPNSERIATHQKKEPLHLGIVPFEKDLEPKRFFGSDLLSSEGEVVYDSKKVMSALLE